VYVIAGQVTPDAVPVCGIGSDHDLKEMEGVVGLAGVFIFAMASGHIMDSKRLSLRSSSRSRSLNFAVSITRSVHAIEVSVVRDRISRSVS
jgi:hypothetical protein